MFSTLDSQPQEWLTGDANAMHTLCICVFRDSRSAKEWIHRLVPKDQNSKLLKWSHGGGKKLKRDRRLAFLSNVERDYEAIDFNVHCISSTEGQISQFTQAFYLQNFFNVTQESDDKKRNCLVFKTSDTTSLRVPVLRAAKLLWIFFCLKYMKEMKNLDGFILSDWFSCDLVSGENAAMGVKTVNFLLQNSGIGLQLSIPYDPRRDESELLSDWFSGVCNSSKNGTVDEEFSRRFDALADRIPQKIDAINYGCNLKIV